MRNQGGFSTSQKWGGALALFGFGLPLLQWGLETRGVNLSPTQGNLLLVLAALSFSSGLTIIFWAWMRAGWSRLRREDALHEVERERDEARATLKTPEQRLEEFGVKLTGGLDKQIAKTKQLTNELRNGRLQEENRELKEKLRQTKQDLEVLRQEIERFTRIKNNEWRQRTEKWEAVIRDFDFHADNFASTGTYFDMEEYLRPEVIEMFKKRTVHIGNEAHGDLAYKPALLREAARIKRERGVI